MPMIENNGVIVWHLRDRNKQLFHWAMWAIAALVFMGSLSQLPNGETWRNLLTAPETMTDIGGRALPNLWNFETNSWDWAATAKYFGYMNKLWDPIVDTINIATLGTIAALIMAVPIAFLAARNTTPSRLFIRPIALLIIVSTRSVNSLIWALLLVSIVGPGVFAGFIAISIRSIGFCAKLLYEAIEEIDKNQVEAITATGAKGWQVLVFGIVPQILPSFAGIAVFRWDINIRESTVLGIVGAGGIGVQLQGSLDMVRWTQISLILLVILLAVVISEWVSAKVRGAII